MAIAIRKHVAADLDLDQLGAAGMFDETRAHAQRATADGELAAYYLAQDWTAFMKACVRARKTIVVSGGTSTGKTTFLNALLQAIPNDERLIVIEDTPELALRQANSVGLLSVRSELGEARVSADDLLIASLRMRPDRIIVGEIRGREAFTFLRAVNVGHPGSLTTIHADTPEGAIDQLALLVLQAGSNLRREDVADFVQRSVDVFVQLERRNGRRSVSEIRWRGASGGSFPSA
jgi:type IV secretion system protein VirB11